MSDLKQLVDQISSLSVLDVAELVKTLEETWGVSAAAPVAVAAAPAAGSDGGNSDESSDEFDVIITSVGEKKINVIKEIRSITGLGLAEAKDLAADGANIKSGVSKEEANQIKEKLESAGAKVDVKQ